MYVVYVFVLYIIYTSRIIIIKITILKYYTSYILYIFRSKKSLQIFIEYRDCVTSCDLFPLNTICFVVFLPGGKKFFFFVGIKFTIKIYTSITDQTYFHMQVYITVYTFFLYLKGIFPSFTTYNRQKKKTFFFYKITFCCTR